MGGPPGPPPGGPPLGGPSLGGAPGETGQPQANKVQKVKASDVWSAIRKTLKSGKDGQKKSDKV